MTKCLVLGGNGFIGSHLVDSLAKNDFQIRVFDRVSADKPRYDAHDNIETFNGDFLNRQDLVDALEGVDYLFHFISTTTPISAENDPLIDIETNIKMSVALFEECVKKKVKKVIFASTGGAIYGSGSGSKPISEDVIPEPVSPYAIGKLTIEHYLHYFARKFDLPSVVFRISNPYGERQALNSKQGVIPIFLENIAAGKPITVFGDGSMVRDYIYVKDVADMIAASFKDAQHHVYNLGSGQGVSLNELIEEVKEVSGEKFEISHKPNLSTFVDKVVLDVSRFETEFNLHPSTSLRDGIQKTWEYYKERV